jgi:vacuolar-type H+-ATPase subunit H
MCMICVDFQRQKMTIQDARRALREMTELLEPEHVEQVQEMLTRAEEEQEEVAQSAAQSGPTLKNGSNP